MVRSPHPHARIVGIDRPAALAMPGVLGVFTGADCAGRRSAADPARSGADDQIRHEAHRPRRHARSSSARIMLLPRRQGAPCRRGGRHGGRRNARRRRMDGRRSGRGRLRGAAAGSPTSEDALKPGAPAVWDELPDNILVDTHFGDAAATDAAFATRRACRRHGLPHRPRHRRAAGAARRARPLRRRDRPLHALCRQRRRGAAEARARRRARHRRRTSCASCRSTSAAISARATASIVEFGLVLWASRKLGRPVKFTRDALGSVPQRLPGPRPRHRGRAGARRRTASSWRCAPTNISNVGARCVSLSPLSKGSGLITGSYDIPVATLRARAVFTNTMPTQAYRSSGRPEVTFAIERLIDKAAARARLRPHRAAPHEPRPARSRCRTATRSASLYDSGDYEENMDRAHGASPTGTASPARAREARRRAASCSGVGLRQLRRIPRSARRRSGADIIVQPDGVSTSSSARSRRARATRPASRRSSPICSACRSRACSIIARRHRRGAAPAAARIPAARCAMPRTVIALGRARADRQGQGARRASSSDVPPDKVDVRRTAVFRVARQQPHLRLSRARRGSCDGTSCPTTLKDGLRVVADNEMHDAGVSERRRASARSRSIPRPAASTSRAMPRSTMSAAASIR